MTAEELVLVVVVAQFHQEKKVLDALLKAGAGGATYFHGRGTGVRQRLGFLGNFIQSEKVIVMAALPASRAPAVLAAATEAASLEKPGNGFACVLKLEQAIGLL